MVTPMLITYSGSKPNWQQKESESTDRSSPHSNDRADLPYNIHFWVETLPVRVDFYLPTDNKYNMNWLQSTDGKNY